MNIYADSVYLVIEVEESIFNQVTEHLISHSGDSVKYLLANQEETKYLSEILNVDVSQLECGDYFKIVKVGQ